MSDKVSSAVRSATMSRIRSTNTGLELPLRRALHRVGLRYRVRNRLPGCPDLVFGAAKVLIFVDSCFWHACRLHCRRPKTNRKFWSAKFERNARRDLSVTQMYANTGWKVVRIWEHDLLEDFDGCVNRLLSLVKRRLHPP